MFQIERHEKIVEFVNEKKKTTTEQLAQEFGVTKVTIRRDIDILAQKGLLIKVHGGAISVENSTLHEIPFAAKSNIHTSAKQAIGVAAAAMIEDGDIIILDSGSTTLEIAKNITQKNISVVTDDIKIAMELSSKENVTVIVCGGILSDPVYTLTGNVAVNFFSRLHVNKTFLGCDAVHHSFGISNRTYEEVDIKSAMIRAADEIIMVTDDSKLGKKVFCYLCDISAINKLVINKIDDFHRRAFIEKGVEIITTDVE